MLVAGTHGRCRSQNRLDATTMRPSGCVRILAASVLVAIGLVGCSSVDATHADAIKAWRTTAQPSLDKVNDALTWFEGAVKSSDYTGALAACRSFSGGVDSLEQQLPSPDDAVTGVLREAVSHFRDFARGCLTVNPDMTRDEANVVVSYRDRGIERLHAAIDMMDHLEQQ
jgi:hypothetical protein